MLIETVSKFLSKDEHSGMRAAFEAAMVDRIAKEGYKMSDLMFEVFLMQDAISHMQDTIEHLEMVLEKNSRLSKPKKEKAQ